MANEKSNNADNATTSLPSELVKAMLKHLTGENPDDKKAWNPSVVREGDKIILPAEAKIPDIIQSLKLKHDEEERASKITVTIDCPPWDGAVALQQAIEQELGMFIQKAVGSMWEPPAASRIEVEVEFGKTMLIPWGVFELPGMEGAKAQCNTAMKDGLVVFRVDVSSKTRYEARVRKLLAACSEIASKNSIHRGKAFSMAFEDENGNQLGMPMPKFFRMSSNDPIFSVGMEKAIERNIFTPIKHSKDLQEMGISLKRGVLFAGTYGTGKTMLAGKIARFANQYGWTFLYVKEPGELPQALRYAQQYQPVVVFAEDVDRVAGPERTDQVNQLLNQLDGIDTKATQILTVLTTNRADIINPAMRRPGRIDLILEVKPPDADTVSRMMRSFCGDNLDTNEDISGVSEVMAGNSPARIREVVDRARLESIRRTGKRDSKITNDDLSVVAEEILAESRMFNKEADRKDADHAALFGRGLKAAGEAMNKVVESSKGSVAR